MSEDPSSDPVGRFAERLDKAPSGQGGARQSGGKPGLQQGLAVGFRIGIELVTAVVVSVGLGWAIDRWLGTRPWVMLVMFFLGVGAGMLNVYRAVTGTAGPVGSAPRKPDSGTAAKTASKWDDEDC